MSTSAGLVGFLSSFDHLDDRTLGELGALVMQAPTLELRRGEILIRQGDRADTLYFVLSGRFNIMLDGTDEPIAEIAQGQPIGEIGFFADLPRAATVVALRDSRVAVISRERFRTICDGSPEIRDVVITTLARRLADTHGRAAVARPAARTIAVVPAGRSAPSGSFVDALRTIFEARGRTVVLTAADLAGRFVGAAMDDPSASNWLNSLEDEAAFVIYVADDALTDWTQKCIRQADSILLVADCKASVKLNPSEAFAFALHNRTARRLVILHERRTLIASGTSAWIADRDVCMHHHVTLQDLADVERLFRFISGRALGFVASGGGALGAAHLGAFKALRQAGAKFDILGGTSAGAAMLAGLACTDDPDRVDSGMHNVFVRSRVFHRFTLPRFSLIDHKAFDRVLQAEYQDTLIEDLWTPYFAVSSNLSSQRPRIHHRGLVWQAVRASGSIPGVLPPFFTREGEMLVDGALMQNIPLEPMTALKTGPNIVVAVNANEATVYPVDYESIPGRRQLAGAMLNPFSHHRLHAIPNILQVIVLSMMANSQSALDLGDSDVVIKPEIPSGLGYMSWDHHTEIFRHAYSDVSARVANPDAEDGARLRTLIAP